MITGSKLSTRGTTVVDNIPVYRREVDVVNAFIKIRLSVELGLIDADEIDNLRVGVYEVGGSGVPIGGVRLRDWVADYMTEKQE